MPVRLCLNAAILARYAGGKIVVASLCALFLMLGAASESLAEKAKAKAKKKPVVKKELVLSPNPVVLLDVQTGRVLYHRDANKKWYPASLTKLMTAYVAFKAIEAGELSEDSVLQISAHALSYPPSKMGFKVGTQVTVGNALKMVIVKSANDISAALGERVAGSEKAFVARMNAAAKRLGMTATNFVNANGLYSPLQTSSARDMAILTRQILLEFPQHRSLFQIPAIRHGKRVLRSYNKLLETFRGTDGMKTGFVCASGYNIVASATRNGRQLVAVVLGAPNVQIRAETAAYLMAQGFSRSDMQSGAGVALGNHVQFGSVAAPTNMRPQVCGKGSSPKWVARQVYKTSYLEARFKLMEPVRVYAGAGKKKRVGMPLKLAQLPMSAPKAKQGGAVRIDKQGEVKPKLRGKQVFLVQLPRPKPL